MNYSQKGAICPSQGKINKNLPKPGCLYCSTHQCSHSNTPLHSSGQERRERRRL